jgi:glycine/D-amino acid oxidase-like deaminating enzyme
MNSGKTMNVNKEDAKAIEVDYLILGQGLCGTLLSRCLLQAGKSIAVIDESKPLTASKVASGVINPVTGRRIVRTWRIEELLPFAWDAYTSFGHELGVELVSRCNILDFHPSHQMEEAFEQRLPEEPQYLRRAEEEDQWKTYFHYHYGVCEINPCLLVDLHTMLSCWRRKLIADNLLFDEVFDWGNCTVQPNNVIYKNITARKIICCEGVAGFENPYFKNLPYSRMKGEALIVSIPGLPRTNIYKQGLNIVPWKDDLWWIGSTYEWDFKDAAPTPAWRKKVEEQLKYWLKFPFETVDHLASERPANMERRPFVGAHPQHPAVAIFNGMGAKGCSLAPFFARQLTDHLVEGLPIYADADVKRFEKMLLRKMN